MKKPIATPCRLAALLVAALNAQAQTASQTTAQAASQTPPAAAVIPPLGPVKDPLWLRYSAISPDGQQIAFAFGGNLYLVPTAGGSARLLVGNGAHSTAPVWSPDGRSIAYASDPNGNFDVFVVSAEGGPSRRLTTHSTSELPLSFTPDSRFVLFKAQRMDAPRNIAFPSRALTELYQVAIDGGQRPTQLLTTPAMAAQYNKAGSLMLYEDWKGYENDFRKHHISPVARDIWLYDAKAGTHRKLTTFGGEDRNPVWSPDEQAVYYLSERSGSFNVWRLSLNQPVNTSGQPEAAVQITRFSKNPVRFLSIAANGMLSFGYDGELYTLDTKAAGAAEPKKVSVQIASDTRSNRVETLKLTQGITEIAPSPAGQEIAFVIRGEIFVASTEFGDTRRISDTPTQERSVSFSPDGRRLLFAGERDGSWNLYEASLSGSKKDNPVFYAAPHVQVKTLLKNGKDNFQPRYSPDGKEVAYLENRNTLKVLNLASGQSRVVMPGSETYSYEDGDQWFDWSPDGQSLLVNFVDRNRWSLEVGLVDAQGKGKLLNLTQNGYEDNHPVFTQGGKAMMWLSDRAGLHANGGTPQQDLYAMFFTREAYDRYQLDKADYAFLKQREDDEKKDKDKEKDKDKNPDKTPGDKPANPNTAKDGKDAAAFSAKKPARPEDKKAIDQDAADIKLPPPVVIERDNLDERTVRITASSGDIRAAVMTADGEGVYHLQKTADGYELWGSRLRAKESKKLADFPPSPERSDNEHIDLQLDAKGETAFVLVGGAMHKFKVPKDDGSVKTERLKFSADMRLDRGAERAYLFDHVWRQTREKLYVQDMGGVDWAYYRQVYEKFLPYVTDNHDFADLLSEMLGELNVSHTGAGYRPRAGNGDATAALGAFFDESYSGVGVKVVELIESGPLLSARSAVKAGMVIEKIDGVTIAPGAEFDSLLNQKAGKRVELSVFDPATSKRFEQMVRPISGAEQNELLYRRWIKTQRDLVDKLSGGRLGYVHVRGMDDPSYRQVYSDVLGRYSGKEALIVDTRFNGGGNLHDDLATFLSGKQYLEFLPRGQSLGWEPGGRWNKPSVVLVSESNYSDAHLFPWVYKHLNIGKLVGMPVAGTGTAVWWETLQDPTLYFGIPMVGFRDAKGEFMEKALVTPDIEVANDPALLKAGRDQQLEAAVKELLKKP